MCYRADNPATVQRKSKMFLPPLFVGFQPLLHLVGRARGPHRLPWSTEALVNLPPLLHFGCCCCTLVAVLVSARASLHRGGDAYYVHDDPFAKRQPLPALLEGGRSPRRGCGRRYQGERALATEQVDVCRDSNSDGAHTTNPFLPCASAAAPSRANFG